jgi:hypothetical protein
MRVALTLFNDVYKHQSVTCGNGGGRLPRGDEVDIKIKQATKGVSNPFSIK